MYCVLGWGFGSMTQGLQCFNSDGVMTLDVTNRLTRVLGEFNTGTANGSLADIALTTGTPWWIAIPTSEININADNMAKALNISVSGQIISWTFTSPYSPTVYVNHKIIYGVF